MNQANPAPNIILSTSRLRGIICSTDFVVTKRNASVIEVSCLPLRAMKETKDWRYFCYWAWDEFIISKTSGSRRLLVSYW